MGVLHTGTYRKVTKRGKSIIQQSMEEEGIVLKEHLLLRPLGPNECVLKDGKPEYHCVDGNHRLAVIRDMGATANFVCDICKVSAPHTCLLQ